MKYRQPPTEITLQTLLSRITLRAAAIEAQICISLQWTEEILEFYKEYSYLIPAHQKEKINRIIANELQKMLSHLPEFLLPPIPGTLKNAPSRPKTRFKKEKLICNGKTLRRKDTALPF